MLPASETIVHSVRAHPGDRVTVFIAKTRTRDLWYVSLQDDTDGQGFDRLTNYSGPGRSAEWVDESLSAPSGTECGAGVAPDSNGTVVCPIAPLCRRQVVGPRVAPVSESDCGHAKVDRPGQHRGVVAVERP